MYHQREHAFSLKLYNESVEECILWYAGKIKNHITTLDNKDNYAVDYRTLKLYLKLGMRLKAVHRVLSVDQCAWSNTFIEFNSASRKQVISKFGKDFSKLKNNAPYGMY